MSVSDLDVEVEDGSLVVTTPGFSDLSLSLPPGFDEDELRCKFDKAQHELTITVPAPEARKVPDPRIEPKVETTSAPEIEPKVETTSAPETKSTTQRDCDDDQDVKLEAEITAFYQKHNPDKLSDVPRLLAKYRAGEGLETMLARLKIKYASKTAVADDKASPLLPAAAVSAAEKKPIPAATSSVTAMGRSMAERLRESGAEADAAAMEDVLRQMEAAATGGVDEEAMSKIGASLDAILAQASEGIPADVVDEIKEKAPERWANRDDPSTVPPVAPAPASDAAPKQAMPEIRSSARPVSLPDEPLLSPEEQAVKKKEEGNAEFKKKRYPAAINRYTEAIKLKPDFASCYSNRSLVYFRTGEYTKAREDAQRCIEQDPKFVKGYMRLAMAQIELKAFKEAKATVRQGLTVELDEPDLLGLLREIKEREWEEELAACQTQEDRLELERGGVHKSQQRRKEEAEAMKGNAASMFDGGGGGGSSQAVAAPAWEAEIEIEDIVTPGAAKALEKEQAERKDKRAKRKEGRPAGKKTKTAPLKADLAKVKASAAKGEHPRACVEGLTKAMHEFHQEFKNVWGSRQEVFLQVWQSDEMMTQLGGRLPALANVISNISKYPQKPFGLELDQETFFALLPELSPPAVQAYEKEPGRFYALMKEISQKDWKKDTERLHGEERLAEAVIEVGGYLVPFDEARAIMPEDDAALDFGGRVALYGNLRALFLYQTTFLIVSILLAQAVEKKIIGAQ